MCGLVMGHVFAADFAGFMPRRLIFARNLEAGRGVNRLAFARLCPMTGDLAFKGQERRMDIGRIFINRCPEGRNCRDSLRDRLVYR